MGNPLSLFSGTTITTKVGKEIGFLSLAVGVLMIDVSDWCTYRGKDVFELKYMQKKAFRYAVYFVLVTMISFGWGATITTFIYAKF
jgi:hypothetical protein